MSESEARVVLALGSNLGDRLEHLREGVRGLAGVVRIRAVSPVYASAPVGYPSQPDFLNAVLDGWSILEPGELLAAAHGVEALAGRLRTFPGGPRTLDIDLVLHGARIVREGGVSVPHPRWKERSFVLAPMADVAPDMVDPEGGRTVQEIWDARRPDLPPVERAAPPEALWRTST